MSSNAFWLGATLASDDARRARRRRQRRLSRGNGVRSAGRSGLDTLLGAALILLVVWLCLH